MAHTGPPDTILFIIYGYFVTTLVLLSLDTRTLMDDTLVPDWTYVDFGPVSAIILNA